MFKGMRKSDRRFTIAFCVLSVSLCVGIAATPTSPPPPLKPLSTVAPASVPKAEVRPTWTELTEAQRIALAPLQSEWSTIDLFRKKKWLQISSRFATMKPDEQQRLQEKMRSWAKLSPDERRRAREVYSRTKSLDAEQKSAEWQQYQQLSDSEKIQLSKDIAAKKHVANLPNASAKPSIKPVIKPPKVLDVPVTKPVPAMSKTASSAIGSEVVPAPQSPTPAVVTPGK